MNLSTLVVAIDGPAGSGKSSTSKGVAQEMGLRYLDTGALYRAMTWWMLKQGIDVEDADAVVARCHEPVIEPTTDPQAFRVSVDGLDVSHAIRTSEVAESVSAVSRVPQVRERLVALQRELIGTGGVVVEGRDIGTVVAPAADLKIYLTAAPEARAQRRAGDLGRGADQLQATQEAMGRRDLMDSTRAVSPLAKAEDAIELDTSLMTLPEVIAAVADLLRSAT